MITVITEKLQNQSLQDDPLQLIQLQSSSSSGQPQSEEATSSSSPPPPRHQATAALQRPASQPQVSTDEKRSGFIAASLSGYSSSFASSNAMRASSDASLLDKRDREDVTSQLSELIIDGLNGAGSTTGKCGSLDVEKSSGCRDDAALKTKVSVNKFVGKGTTLCTAGGADFNNKKSTSLIYEQHKQFPPNVSALVHYQSHQEQQELHEPPQQHVMSPSQATPPKKRRCRSLTSAAVEWESLINSQQQQQQQQPAHITSSDSCHNCQQPPPGDVIWQPHPSSIWKPVPRRLQLTARRRSPLMRTRCAIASPSPLPSDSPSPDLGRPSPDLGRPGSDSSGFWDSSMSVYGGLYRADTPSPACNQIHVITDFAARCSSAQAAPALAQPPPGGAASPPSPARAVVPRCRSQPCGSRAAFKRRRELDRPFLNFNKMKETAYGCELRIGGATVAGGNLQTQHMRPSRSLASLHCEPACFLGLNTIASSPLGSGAATPCASAGSSDTAAGCSVNMSRSPEHAQDAPIMPFGDQRGAGQGSPPPPPLVHDLDEEDSGLSDIQDDEGSPQLITNNPDLDWLRAGGDVTADEQVFEISINDDIDLEEMEKD